jgi:hypothetical protein
VESSAPITLYELLSSRAPDSGGLGRTEQTATVETIDRDRQLGERSEISGLYPLLSGTAPSGGNHGRTQLTESTETIDWDRPPDDIFGS